jgi:hypothetical protein
MWGKHFCTNLNYFARAGHFCIGTAAAGAIHFEEHTNEYRNSIFETLNSADQEIFPECCQVQHINTTSSTWQQHDGVIPVPGNNF